ncbi:MAG: cytochrome c oxidase assembly protein [Methylococcaceae bacterium]|jgi:cytochrome c oxidase assembly protein subunit 11|nr:cytochrome c oxidase assembly protein [Methylococcaceae bacterium]MDZ4158021.1 cytochrome c oxidase assembly protein [Methylococcales bacterium]MDP2392812.1 cytochrome c oxidase assembly protein [Methylococcaceae bacterium]MDP3020340.1 cytochrome c oxidase assembly protein [Methylococcaceae bacterium]MDP3391947.1 cytochrome c oxidase assembly protein [Methylococcaceae bacterium]
MNRSVSQKNIKLARNLIIVAIAMFGFGYALVPIYDVLCELKWIERDRPDALKQAKEKAYEIDKDRDVTIEFVSSINENTPLLFHSEIEKLKVHPGEYHTVNFYAENKTDNNLNAMAVHSYAPAVISKFVDTITCFCLNEQSFKPKESKVLPVRFVINPELPEQYKTITLSYTFFDRTENQ